MSFILRNLILVAMCNTNLMKEREEVRRREMDAEDRPSLRPFYLNPLNPHSQSTPKATLRREIPRDFIQMAPILRANTQITPNHQKRCVRQKRMVFLVPIFQWICVTIPTRTVQRSSNPTFISKNHHINPGS